MGNFNYNNIKMASRTLNTIVTLRALFFLPVVAIYLLFCNKNTKYLIAADFYRWAVWQGMTGSRMNFCRLFIQMKEFRNIVYKRLGVAAEPLSWIWHRQNNLTIACSDIGPGLIIQHGYSTVICAKRIGKNFWVNQCVNIVWNGSECPTIGDNVSVYTGAIIVGGVTIGHNVTIGAGAVVVKNIPDNSLAIGNPARIIPKHPIP